MSHAACRLRAAAALLLVAAPFALAQTVRAAGALDRIREAARLRVGYRVDARPFSYKTGESDIAGYSIELCRKVADDVKTELGLSSLSVDWVPLGLDQRFSALQQGRVDMLCGADTVTLERRAEVSFSIPIFPGGVGALIRADAAPRLRDVLAGRGQPFRPTWRAAATQLLQTRVFSVVGGTTADEWLAARFTDLHISADVRRVASYDVGVRAVVDRTSDALFGERAILLAAARHSGSGRDVVLVDRLFSHEPLAFALPRGDENLRLVVDRSLSRLYRSGAIGDIYAHAFGEPDEQTLTFFRWNALPD